MRTKTARVAFTLIILIGLGACATSPKTELVNVRPGMDKDDVLNLVGNPKRTLRTEGEDRWIYVYFEEGRELHQEIDFREGKVIRTRALPTGTSLEKELEATKTMEEFESKVREHRAGKSGAALGGGGD